MSNGPRHLYEFGPFQLSEHEGVLRRDGHALSLTPKAFDLLLALLKGGGRVLTKDELLQTVWAGAQMDESNLPTQIAIVRKVVGNGYVETIARRGYRFTGAITEKWEEPDNSSRVAATAPSSLDSAPESPDLGQATVRPPRATRRWYFAAVVAAVAVTVCAIVGLALRDHGFTPARPPARPATGRLFARATSEGASVRELKLDRVPESLLITPDGKKLYAMEYASKSITVVDGLGLEVKARIALPSAFRCATLTRDGRRLYVGSQTEGVMVVDTEHDRVLERVLPTGGAVYSLAVTPDEKKLFLAMASSGLKRISTSTGESKLLSAIACPVGVEIEPAGRELYVSYQCGGPGGRSGHDAVEIYDVNSERVTATVNGPPMVGGALAFAPNAPYALLPGGDACSSPAYDHAGCPSVPSIVYHLLRSTDRKVVKTFTTPAPMGMSSEFAPDSKRIVLSGESIRVMDPFKDAVLEEFQRIGESYGSVAFTPAGNRAFIAVRPTGILVLDVLDPGCLPTSEGVFNLFSGDGTLDDEHEVGSLVAEGGLGFAPGLVGQAFHFNGTDSLLRTNIWEACGGCGDSWSGSFYVKFSSLQGEMSIFERLHLVTDPELRLFKSDDNRIVLETVDRSKPRLFVSTSAPVVAGNWYHLAVVTHLGERTLYVNGTLAGRVQMPIVSPNRLGANIEGAYIGASRDRKHFLNGMVDELAFYNRALTPSEINAMYELILHRPCSPGRAR